MIYFIKLLTTSDSIKPVIDTIRQVIKVASPTSDNSLDVLQKINAFYDSAWNKLLWVVGILITMVGVVIPLVIQYWQNKKVKTSEDELKQEIENAIAAATSQFTSYVDERVKNKFEELDLKFNKQIVNLNGKAFQLQGAVLFDVDAARSAASYLVAIESFINAGDIEQVKKLIIYLTSTAYNLDSLSKVDLKKALESQRVNYRQVLSNFADEEQSEDIKELCQRLILMLDSIS